MFTSKDLVNWKQVGHVFTKQPSWTSNSFWAPELFYHNNKVYCYYTARQKSTGISYIGVAYVWFSFTWIYRSWSDCRVWEGSYHLHLYEKLPYSGLSAANTLPIPQVNADIAIIPHNIHTTSFFFIINYHPFRMCVTAFLLFYLLYRSDGKNVSFFFKFLFSAILSSHAMPCLCDWSHSSVPEKSLPMSIHIHPDKKSDHTQSRFPLPVPSRYILPSSDGSPVPFHPEGQPQSHRQSVRYVFLSVRHPDGQSDFCS